MVDGKLKKICICGEITEKTPCKECRSRKNKVRDAARGNSTQRGYNSDYSKKRRTILSDGPSCYLCGKPGADSVDHEIALTNGGTNEISNLKPSHLKCNLSKGSR